MVEGEREEVDLFLREGLVAAGFGEGEEVRGRGGGVDGAGHVADVRALLGCRAPSGDMWVKVG